MNVIIFSFVQISIFLNSEKTFIRHLVRHLIQIVVYGYNQKTVLIYISDFRWQARIKYYKYFDRAVSCIGFWGFGFLGHVFLCTVVMSKLKTQGIGYSSGIVVVYHFDKLFFSIFSSTVGIKAGLPPSKRRAGQKPLKKETLESLLFSPLLQSLIWIFLPKYSLLMLGIRPLCSFYSSLLLNVCWIVIDNTVKFRYKSHIV